MKNQITRRNFIKSSSTAAAAISAGSLFTNCSTNPTSLGKNGMPQRILGKTGQKVSILAYGCGSQFMKMPDGEWEPHFEYAYNSGINYFDTASTYGSDDPVSSEERLSKVIGPVRKDIFLVTKIHERDPEKAKAEFDRSLKRLNTDYVDLLLIHAVRPEDSVSDTEHGVYKFVADMKDQKKTRFIGFSSMDSAERSKELIENLEFDATLLAMNATQYGDFIQVTLPAARKKNMGIISMKIMRNIVDKGAASPAELLQYNWNLQGVSTNLVSQTGMAPLKQNIEIAKAFTGQTQSKLFDKELEQRLALLNDSANFVWAQEGYFDGMIC